MKLFLEFKVGTYHLAKDKKDDFLVENINIIDGQLVVECSRSLQKENSLSEDLSLDDDLLLIFFNVGSKLGPEDDLFIWQRGESQDSGEDAISLLSYSHTAADVRTLKDSADSVTFSLARFRPDPDGEARCQMFEVPKSARLYRGYAPAVTGFNGENGLISSLVLYHCRPGTRVTGSDNCQEFEDQCREVLFNWYPGGSGEILPADIGVTTDRVLLEIVYNTGTGWLYDSSGLTVFFSSSEGGEAELATRFIMKSSSVVVECEGRLVSSSLHSNRPVDNIRLSSPSGTVTSGYQVHHQNVRHLLSPVRLGQGDQLTLDCLVPRQCFAVITIVTKPGENCVQQSISQSNLSTSGEMKESSEMVTSREIPKTRQQPSPPEPSPTKPSATKPSPAAPKTNKVTSTDNKTEDFDDLKFLFPNFTNMKMNLTKIDLSYKNDIADLNI